MTLATCGRSRCRRPQPTPCLTPHSTQWARALRPFWCPPLRQAASRRPMPLRGFSHRPTRLHAMRQASHRRAISWTPRTSQQQLLRRRGRCSPLSHVPRAATYYSCRRSRPSIPTWHLVLLVTLPTKTPWMTAPWTWIQPHLKRWGLISFCLFIGKTSSRRPQHSRCTLKTRRHQDPRGFTTCSCLTQAICHLCDRSILGEL